MKQSVSKRWLWVVWGLLAAVGCGAPAPEGDRGTTPGDVRLERARELARSIVIVDTHVDVPWRMTKKVEDISVRTEDGDFDYPRAREGGLDVPFMSIYVAASYQEDGGAKKVADDLIDMVGAFETDHPEKFVVVRSVADVRKAFADGRVGLALGMENGAPIEDDLANLEHFRDRGVRYITLTHSKDNQICDSSYADTHTWKGLSPFGEQVIAEMNRLGIMIDVSHVDDATFYQVMKLSRAPVIASHSSCRFFTPGWERNMDDAMIALLAEHDGVLQINFGSDFISDAYHTARKAHREAVDAYCEAHDIPPDSDEAEAYRTKYFAEHPVPYADVRDVAAHIDHVAKLVGIDHVGLGSDFDGVGDSLPDGLKDVSYYPNLIAELTDLGYSDDDIEKVCSGNILRVWEAVERIAAESRTD